MNGIADTGFLVAFASDRDAHHEWAVALAAQIREPLLTCESVLSETAFNLGSATAVFEMIRGGLVTPAFEFADHVLQIEALAERYSDRSPDLADLCLIRMSELHPRHTIITTDREDFRVYRRNKREALPLICPPEK
ncbi:MAG: hypothetical protein RL514_3399 [Verrucomicrobiota bacterium]|jgi:predicted nucleic acid-binding protein